MTVLRLAILISVMVLTAMGQQNSPEQRPVATSAFRILDLHRHRLPVTVSLPDPNR
jgi:hypothetical protein